MINQGIGKFFVLGYALFCMGIMVNAQELDTETVQDTVLSTVADSLVLETKVQRGKLLINVRNYEDSYAKIKELTGRYQGEVQREEEREEGDIHKNTLDIVLNKEHFNAYLLDVRALAMQVDAKQVWQEDRVKDYEKINALYQYKQENIEQIKTYLQHTTSMKEKVVLEEQLAELKSDLTQLEGEREVFAQYFTQAQLTVSFYERALPPVVQPEAFGNRFSQQVQQGWKRFKQTLLYLASVWPYLVLLLFFSTIVYLAKRANRKREEEFQLKLLINSQQQTNKEKLSA